jgi:hypothetical protein
MAEDTLPPWGDDVEAWLETRDAAEIAAAVERHVLARVAQAVAQERERCARICEQIDADGEGPDCWGWHAKDYAKALRAGSPSPQPPSAWRPISEAPRDGAEVLVTRHPTTTNPPIDVARWSERAEKEGWVPWRRKSWALGYDPTHWMPLPPPPSAGEEKTA